jgi:hypothetical protein
MAHLAGSLLAIRVCPMTMLVDYKMVIDRPGVSVEGPTQQDVESVVEVTTVSDITSDGSGDPPLQLLLSEGSVLWLELPPLSSLSGSPPAAGVTYGGARGTSSRGTKEGCLPDSTSY